MKSTDLFLLGRRLMKLAEEGLPRQGVNTSARLVLIDVGANPGSSVSEITARTGFPQSHVSASVSLLRQAGVIRTEVDPRDRRRTLVWIVPKAVERSYNRVISTADAAVARALGDAPPDQLDEVMAALEMLAARLGPSGGGRAAAEAS